MPHTFSFIPFGTYKFNYCVLMQQLEKQPADFNNCHP
jgi:hypothetical protein